MTIRTLLLASVAATAPQLTNVPQSVREAAARRLAPAKIERVELERTDAGVVYEFQSRSHGVRLEIKLVADGGVVSEEQEVSLKETPSHIRDAVAAAMPQGSRVLSVERVTTPDGVVWELVVATPKSERLEYSVGPDGGVAVAPASE